MGSTGGLRNSSESGPASSSSPQSNKLCPGTSCRVKNDPEGSEDQGSEAENTKSEIMSTDPNLYTLKNTDHKPYKHLRCEGSRLHRGPLIQSSLRVKRCWRALQGKFSLITDLMFHYQSDWLGFATTVVSIIDKSTTSGSCSLLCSWVRIAGPCGLSIALACEVAPGLPQGGVDLGDRAWILHFT